MVKLNDFALLSFDVYGTLIDWEGGILTAIKPLCDKDPSKSFTKEQIIKGFHELEAQQQAKTPDMPYHKLLATVHGQIADKFGLPKPSEQENEAFGNSVGDWPAFPDTVDALKRLSKTYKLLVLSNVDDESFRKCNAGPLKEIKFDAVLTAQQLGSYKPNLNNFHKMITYVKENFGIEKDQILQTAQSQFHDHQPAHHPDVGLESAWIARQGAKMGDIKDPIFTADFVFTTLGQMADRVESEKVSGG